MLASRGARYGSEADAAAGGGEEPEISDGGGENGQAFDFRAGSGGGASSVGQVGGMTRPAVRKNRFGEAKPSNAEAGVVKRWAFRACRVVISQACRWTSCSMLEYLLLRLVGGVGGRDVATSVQSKMASLVIRPAIRVGRDLEAKLSVRAREVAIVPPRNEP